MNSVTIPEFSPYFYSVISRSQLVSITMAAGRDC